jgi:hypothetical protein
MHFVEIIPYKIQREASILSAFFLLTISIFAQDSLSLFERAPEFHQDRFYSGLGLSTAAYGATLYGLSEAWYKESGFGKFHFQDDFGEWEHVDKAGHIFTNYFESAWVSNSLQWAGIERKKAIYYGVGASLLFQGTIEILDGFSNRWGFSWSDMGANLLGSGIFLSQELLWREQRIRLKWSVQPIHYATTPLRAENGSTFSSPLDRARSLYGTTLVERILKDYNGQSIWLSINIADFLSKDSQWPKWLSLSLGYGAENMYGGYSNRWTEGSSVYDLSSFERYHQFYIGPDIDWSKIKTKSSFLNTLFEMLNILRLPFPALELNGQGQLIWHWAML